MSKTVVIDSTDGSRVFFLRGILTRSLQACGLSFEEAYRVASRVRDELASVTEVTSGELRKRVVAHLEEFDDVVRKRCRRPQRETVRILVRQSDGHTTRFSRGAHRLLLEGAAIPPEAADDAAARIHDSLLRRGITEIREEDLRVETYRRILEDLGKQAARGYLVCEEFRASGRPLMLLIGGVPGTGKSSVATHLAHVLGITRTQPTDMLREVMRFMIPQRLLPALHTSSFLASGVIPRSGGSEDPDAALVEGYLAQSEVVGLACEAAVERALVERLSMILEGVHIHPGLLERLPREGDAILVPVMLAVLRREELQRRFRGRGKQFPGRRAKRYLDNLDMIWRLQAWLLSEADRTNVPIVDNEDREVTVHQVNVTILRALSRTFEGKGEPGSG